MASTGSVSSLSNDDESDMTPPPPPPHTRSMLLEIAQGETKGAPAAHGSIPDASPAEPEIGAVVVNIEYDGFEASQLLFPSAAAAAAAAAADGQNYAQLKEAEMNASPTLEKVDTMDSREARNTNRGVFFREKRRGLLIAGIVLLMTIIALVALGVTLGGNRAPPGKASGANIHIEDDFDGPIHIEDDFGGPSLPGIRPGGDSDTGSDVGGPDNVALDGSLNVASVLPIVQVTSSMTTTSRPTTVRPKTAPSPAPTWAPTPANTNSNRSSTGLGPLSLSVEQITFGPRHHLFGYIGQSLTIPWSGNDRYIVALEFDFHHKLPTAEDAATIILIDTYNDYTVEPLDVTRAWNLQQGTMLFWNPHGLDTQFFFNDRDEDGKVFTALYDIELRERVREYKYSDTPVANGGVCPQGGFFYALNYGRMARLRPVTGYNGAYDWTVGVRAPHNDGIWKIDIETGEKELLVSLFDIANLLDERSAQMYINHELSSRECERIYFFGRGSKGGEEMAVDEPFTMRSDGTGLKKVSHIGGHPEWYDETTLIGRGGDDTVLHDIVTDTRVGFVGEQGTFLKPSGDFSLSPDRRMFVNGWEQRRENLLHYHFLRLADGAEIESEPIDHGPYGGEGAIRIDAAPRWNRAGNKILVPGWATDGTRQLHVISVKEGSGLDL